MTLINDNLIIASLDDLNKLDSLTQFNTEKILCNHCERTSSNGKRCIGICVADSEY